VPAVSRVLQVEQVQRVSPQRAERTLMAVVLVPASVLLVLQELLQLPEEPVQA